MPAEVLKAYELETMEFGPEYIIPTPFDPRLREFVAPAVAEAALRTGVARTGWPSHYPARETVAARTDV